MWGDVSILTVCRLVGTIPLSSTPNDDAHVVTARYQEGTILCKASHRVLMPLHGAEVLSCLEFVHLNLLGVATDNDVARSIELEEVDAQDFGTFHSVKLGMLRVVNGVTELWEDSCGDGRAVSILLGVFLGDFPDGNGAIIAASNQEFLAIEYFSDDAGYRVGMITTLEGLQNDRAIDLQIPKSDCTVFVPSCNESTVGQESHAAELTVLW